MGRLASANRRKFRAYRRRVYREAFEYHYQRTKRLEKSRRLEKLQNSGFIRRYQKCLRGKRIDPETGADLNG